MKKIFLILLVIGGISISCKEIYDPTVSDFQRVFAVDGKITNLPGPYSVKLSYALNYNAAIGQNLNYPPLEYATVTIKDDLDNTYRLIENEPGTYTTIDNDFIGTPGRTYQLFFQTANGETFKSTPQKMADPISIDTIFGKIVSKDYLIENMKGDLEIKTRTGILTYINTSKTTEDLKLRVDLTLLIEYTLWTDKVIFYGWKLASPNLEVPIADLKSKNENISVGFFPGQGDYYQIEDTLRIQHWIMIVNQYSINNDGYNFYKGLNSQITSKNRVFDPINTQIKSNIISVSKPDLKVVGLFEVTSVSKSTYVAIPNKELKTVDYKKVDNLTLEASSGFYPNYKPGFWID